MDCGESELRGRAVLIRTGWDERWGTNGYWEPGPYLADEFVIVEHLCHLSALPRTGFRFYAVPLRIIQGASFPVRAFAEIEE